MPNIFEKIANRSRNLFHRQTNSSASNTAHKIVNKTERAVHSGASDLSKAAHKGINKTQKAAKSFEKDAKKAVKHK
uniref:Uncharacterized protein n=1 Tax=Meloidogyne enterolobii TaxID=390850 RepID=A0A6V7UGN7_MELEN|nr:unnamed protein product [Meloidogyne enterolobii]